MYSYFFVSLPVWLAVGGALGFLTSRYGFSRRWRPALARWLMKIDGAGAALGLFAGLAIIFVAVRGLPTSDALAFAALLLGLASGRWFAASPDNRDKMIFLGFAGVLVVVAALEYDRRILDNITKFGAGTVNVEFAPQKLAGVFGSPQNDIPSGSPFPGANRLDMIVDMYSALPGYIDRDETYAKVFADVTPGRKNSPFDNERLEPKIASFRDYATNFIAPIGEQFRALQSYERSEESTFSRTPGIALSLRHSFELALSSQDAIEAPSPSYGPSQESLGADMKSLRITLVGELSAVCGSPQIRMQTDACLLKKDQEFCADSHPKELVTYCKRAHAAPSAPDRTVFNKVPPEAVDREFRYFAYFAIVVATAEFAADNRENAIQLLDREISREMASPEFENGHVTPSKGCLKSGEEQDVNACAAKNAKRLDWFRRLFVIARLEYVEDRLIEASENTAETPLRVATLRRMFEHFELAFQSMSDGAITDPGLFEGALAEQPAASCRAPLSADPASSSQIARIAFSRIAVENDALWLAATEPEIVTAEPFRIAKLDRSADEVARFDVDCLPALNYPIDIGAVRWKQLDTSAAYWTAEGQRFGLEAEEAQARLGLKPASTLAALCKAQVANRLALRAFSERNAGRAGIDETPAAPSSEDPDAASPLDDRMKAYNLARAKSRLLDRATQIESALTAYPPGDRDRACGS
jgi:hypothetical protein